MAAKNQSAAVITRLGYDPTDLKAGLEQATRDVAQYKAQATLLATELKATRVRLQTEYTAEFRRQTEQRLSDLNSEMARTGVLIKKTAGAQQAALLQRAAALRQQWDAQRQVLVGYQAEQARVRELQVSYTGLRNKADQAAAAQRLFAAAQKTPVAAMEAIVGPTAVKPPSVGTLAALAAARDKELQAAAEQISGSLVASIGKVTPRALSGATGITDPVVLASLRKFGLAQDDVAASAVRAEAAVSKESQTAVAGSEKIAAAADRQALATERVAGSQEAASRAATVTGGRFGAAAAQLRAEGLSAEQTAGALRSMGATQTEISTAIKATYAAQVEAADVASSSYQRLAAATLENSKAQGMLRAAMREAMASEGKSAEATNALAAAQQRAAASSVELAAARKEAGIGAGAASGGAGGFRPRMMVTEGGLRTYLGGAFGGFAGFGAVLAGTMGAHMFSGLSENILKLQNLAAATGTTVRELGALQQVFVQYGVNGDQLNNTLLSLASSMSKAAEGGKQQVQLFSDLGISTEDWATQMPPAISVLMQIADAMHNSTDKTKAAADAQRLLNFYGVRMESLLSQGSRSLNQQAEQFANLGAQESASTQAAKSFQSAWIGLKSELEADVGLPALRGINAIIDSLKTLHSWINRFSQPVGGGTTPTFRAFGGRLQMTPGVMDYFKQRGFTPPAGTYEPSNSLIMQQALEKLNKAPGAPSTANQITVQKKAAADLFAQFQAGGQLQYELRKKEAQMTQAASAGDTKRLQTLIAQADAIKQQIQLQKQQVSLQKQQAAAEAKYAGMIGPLRSGYGGPYGTVAPSLALALQKKITKALLDSGINLPLSSFGMNGFTGNFGGAMPELLPPEITGKQSYPEINWQQLLGYPEGPAPIPGAMPVGAFRQQFTTLQSQYSVGLLSAKKYIDLLEQVKTPLQQEIALRSKAADMSEQQRKTLQQMYDLVKKIDQAEKQGFAGTGTGQMIQTFKEFSDIVGKFSGGLSRNVSEGQAGYQMLTGGIAALKKSSGMKGLTDAFQKSLTDAFKGTFKELPALMEAVGGATGIVHSIVSGPGGALGSLSGALSGAEFGAAIAGPAAPIGAAVGAAVGGIAGIFGSGKAKRKAQEIANNIVEAANKITQALNLGATDLKTAISQLQAQLAQAQQIHGKGTSEIKQQTVDSLTNEINQLEAQQKQILDSFRQALANAELPSGMASFAQQLEQIAKTLKDAAGAGATAAEQIQYLDAAMQNLTTSMGDTLRSEEQNLLSLMQQDISIRQQQQQLLQNENNQIAAIKGGLGVGRAWTPAEQAAIQIQNIKLQATQQLSSLQDQQKMLDAQIGGEAQLYGLSMKDLDVANAKAKILALQVSLQKEATAELVTQIQAEQQWYQELLSGKIPNLPAGGLPSGFSWPTGGSYTFGDININVTGSQATDPNALADSVQQAILQLVRRRQVGLQ